MVISKQHILKSIDLVESNGGYHNLQKLFIDTFRICEFEKVLPHIVYPLRSISRGYVEDSKYYWHLGHAIYLCHPIRLDVDAHIKGEKDSVIIDSYSYKAESVISGMDIPVDERALREFILADLRSAQSL